MNKNGYNVPPCPTCGKFLTKRVFHGVKGWVCRYRQCSVGKDNLASLNKHSLLTILQRLYRPKGSKPW